MSLAEAVLFCLWLHATLVRSFHNAATRIHHGRYRVQGSDKRCLPHYWGQRETLAANQPTNENSLGLFHPVVTFALMTL